MNDYIVCNIPINRNNLIKIAIVGKWLGHTNGSFTLSFEDLKQIKTNFEASKVDGVIDLDHETIFKGTGEAYGWIKELFLQGDELWAKIEWLQNGLELIKTKKYKYISPVFAPNTTQSVSGENIGWTLHSAALTNRPFMEELGEIKANNRQIYNKDKQMTQEEQTRVDELETLVKTLQQQLKAKDEELQELKNQSVEDEINSAIALNKISINQKESLIALGKTNPKELKNFLSSLKAITIPNNNIYTNSNKQNNNLDVLKLIGVSNG